MTDTLFLVFRQSSMGQKVSTLTLTRWIRGCITLALKAAKDDPPQGITAHLLWKAATSTVYSSFRSLTVICKAATWRFVHSFTKHDRIDQVASAEAAFGRKILQHTPFD